jgi:class 3 adenylate cyclase
VPARTVKYILLTDIWHSSALWERFPRYYPSILEFHNKLTESCVGRHQGTVMKNMGDGYIGLFDSAFNAISCAVELQLSLQSARDEDLSFPDGSSLAIRAIIHSGPLHMLSTGHGLFGTSLNRASRICRLCQPNQIIVSGTARAGLHRDLPKELAFEEGGQFVLRDLTEPEQLFSLLHPQLPRLRISRFTPYRELIQSGLLGLLLTAVTLLLLLIVSGVSSSQKNMQQSIIEKNSELELLLRENLRMKSQLQELRTAPGLGRGITAPGYSPPQT